MAITSQQITEFQSFALQALAQGKADSMEELFDLWTLQHPTSESAEADLTAIENGIADANAGRTVPLKQAFEEVRSQLRNQS